MRKYADLVVGPVTIGGTTVTQPISGANVQVLGHVSQVNATIYSDDGVTTTPNPLTTDSNGRYQFYVANGRYDLKFTATGFTTFTLSDIDIHDETDITVPGETPLAGNLIFTGNNSHSGTETFTGPGSISAFTAIQGCQYVDANQTLPQAIAAVSSPGCIFISTNYALTANATIPAGVTLGFNGNGGITTTGFTLTINGPIVAPPSQIFFGTGTVNLSQLASPVQALWFPGSDIGAQLNAAYAALPAKGGEIDYACNLTGTPYNFSTPILFNTVGKQVLLRAGGGGGNGTNDAGGCVLNYTPTTATTAITYDYTLGSGGGYSTSHGWVGVNLTNNGCQTNGGCGSSATGMSIGPVNGGASFAQFVGGKVSGFGTGVTVGNSTSFGMSFVQTNFSWNTLGFNASLILESLFFYGGIFAVNGTGFQGNGAVEAKFYGTEFDSQTVVGVTCNGANHLDFFSTHWENFNSSNVQYINCTNGTQGIYGGSAADDTNSGNASNWFAFNSGVVKGLNLFSAGRTVTNLFSAGTSMDVSVINGSPAVLTGDLGVIFGGATGNTLTQYGPSQTVKTVLPTLRFTEIPAPASGVANADFCYGDSTAHALKCSYNNGTFGQVVLDNATQTLTNKTLTAPTINGTLGGSATASAWSLVAPSLSGNIAIASGALVNATNLLLQVTAPTISSGFGTSPSVATQNSTAAFTINVGTGGTATSGVIGFPSASNGWNVQCTDITTNSATVFVTKQTATTATTATIGNFNTSAAAAAWAASDILSCTAFAR